MKYISHLRAEVGSVSSDQWRGEDVIRAQYTLQRDAEMTAAVSAPPGTVCCMLCRGVVAYRAGDSARFTAHMHHEHGAYFDMEFLLAACLMNEEEREAVRSVMATKIAEQGAQHKQKEDETLSKSSVPNTPPSKRTKQDEDDVEVIINNIKQEEVKEVTEESSDDQPKMISFECGDCGKSFKHRKSLKIHQNRTHGDGATKSSTTLPALTYPTPPKSVTPQPSSPLVNKTNTSSSSSSMLVSSTSFFENMEKSWMPAKDSKTKPEISDNYSFKQESIVPKVVAMDEDSREDLLQEDDDPDDPEYGEDETSKETVSEVTVPKTSEGPKRDTKEKPAVEADVSKSKYFKANPQSIGKLGDNGSSLSDFTTVDPKLPSGWRVKEYVKDVGGGRKEKKKFFLTRDHHILKTGLAVLEFMRLTGQFTAKQIMDIAKYLAVPVSRLEKYMELYL